MKYSEIPQLRLLNQQLTRPSFQTPEEVVTWFGAIQAQDYLGSLWAIGERMQQATEQTIEQAIAERKIVRSWPMRGTLHFVHAKDIRWIQKLLAPRIIKRSAFRYRELELSEETFTKSRKILANTLIGGKQLKRSDLIHVLEKNTITTDGQRGIHILGRLAMEGLLCLGARDGKQFTFTLLDEWIPQGKSVTPEHAISELTKRYFFSHGPATLKDFQWWSGLSTIEVKEGLEMVNIFLDKEIIENNVYYFKKQKLVNSTENKAFLLPPYDEYTVAYKKRTAVLEEKHFAETGNGIFRPTILMNGKIIGTWKRELRKHQVIITLHLLHMITQSEQQALQNAAQFYGKFLKREVVLK